MEPITRSNAFPYCRGCMPHPLAERESPEAAPHVALAKPGRLVSTMRLHLMLLAVLLLAVSVISSAADTRVPPGIFKDLGLTPQQIAAIDAGRPVAKMLSWGNPSEVYVFGAVHVKGSPEAYLKAARDVGRLSGTPGYRGAGEIRETATAEDLSALALEPDDVKALKICRDGSCDVQLPTVAMQAFQDRVTWWQPDAAQQANAL